MGSIATTTFDRHGSTWDVRILQASASDSIELKITGLTRTQGSKGADVLTPILPSRVQMQLRDPKSSILDRLQSNPLDDFEVEIDRDGSRWHEGTLLESDLGNSAWTDPKLTLSWGGRIQQLSRSDQYYRPDGAGGPTGPDWRWQYLPSGDEFHEMGRVPACIFHTATDLDARTYWNFDHSTRGSSKNRVAGHRMRANDVARDQYITTRQNALTRFCRTWGLQAVQHEGKFYILERAMRADTSHWGEYATTGNLTQNSTGTEQRKKTISDSDVRRDAQIQPIIKRSKYTQFRLGRYRAENDIDEFRPEVFSFPDPAQDVWDYNVDRTDSSWNYFTQDSHYLDRIYPWERPGGSRSEDEMTVVIDMEVDVGSGASFNGGSALVTWGTFYENNENGESTVLLQTQVFDSDAGTTVTDTKTFQVADKHEARVELNHDRDPDGDNDNELDEMRVETSASWSGDIKERGAIFTTANDHETPKDITTVMGAGRLTNTDARFRVFSMAGVVGIWQGSDYERLPGSGSWSHPKDSNTSDDIHVIVEAVLDDQVQPKGNPLNGWRLEQDIDAPGGITYAFDYQGNTYIPLYVRTDVMAGRREIEMYEIRS